MKQMISRLIKRKEDEIVESSQKDECSNTCWFPCQHVYYLFDTLKLQYESENGLITVERVSTGNVEKILEAMISSPCLPPKYTAGIPSLCSISLCGVSWEESQYGKRVRAIPEAAVFRCENIKASSSEIQLKCAGSTASPNSRLDIKTGLSIKKIHNLSFEQFVAMLRDLNGNIPSNHSQSIQVNADNFCSHFTDSEDISCISAVKRLFNSKLPAQ